MKLAYIILAHKDPDQVIGLVNALDTKDSIFIVNIDKKSDAVFKAVRDGIGKRDNVIFPVRRPEVKWGRFSLVEATLECIRTLLGSKRRFDYAVLLSGQDYPIKDNDHIRRFFEENDGGIFLDRFAIPDHRRWPAINGGMDRLPCKVYFFNRFFLKHPRQFKDPWLRFEGGIGAGLRRLGYGPYSFFKRVRTMGPGTTRQGPKGVPREAVKGVGVYGGSQWWALPRPFVRKVMAQIEKRPFLLAYFKKALVPDELFFQTVVMSLEVDPKLVRDNVHLVIWGDKATSHPKVLDLTDLEALERSDKLFARKFDWKKSRGLIRRLDGTVLRGRCAGPGK